MEKHFVRNFFGKAVMSILVAVMIMSGVCLFDGEGSVAYAADETYYITESQTGLTVTDDMTAPKPTTEGKETYIFAGYYTEATCETPIKESTDATVYKKFVPADIMSVKAQVTTGTKEDSSRTDMRLVTTVDGLNYKEVGFDVYFNGSKTPVNAKTTTVYKRIIAADSGNAFGYSPEAFNAEAEYFTTVNLVNIANKNFDKTFFIKPYWKTLDGTKVYGMGRMARVSDSYNKIINVPVRLYTDAMVNAGTFDVGYTDYASILTYKGYDNGEVYEAVEAVNDVENTKVTVTTPSDVTGADGMVVNLRFQVNDGQTMPSNATFTVTSDYGTALANVEYKTFSVVYTGVADTSWYDEFKEGTEFVLTTPADLYGFAQIVNDSTGDYYKEQFAGDTVRLGADVIINQGNAADWSASNAPANKWTPIGYKAGYRFQGTFDGCGNEIKGIYCMDDYENRTSSQEHYTGLFGITHAESTVRNFSLTNSYFESIIGWNGYAMMGSIAGQLAGNMDTVYSDAIVNSAYMHVGGIVGRTNPGSTTGVCQITNCWFDGNITVNEETCETQGVGGILGKIVQGNAELTDCLNTANVTYTATALNNSSTTSYNVGIGGIHGVGGAATMTNCLNVGTVKVTLPTGVRVLGINYYGTRTNSIDSTSVANYNGYKGYTELKNKNFSFYDWDKDTGAKDAEPGKWVCRVTADSAIDGIPVLKSFCDEWIDVSWYYDDTEATEFTISHAEEFYGWSEISNKADVSFAKNVTVKLGADIKMNNGEASVWATTTNTAITDSLRKWTPIDATNAFAGTFDGQDHTISGIYLNETSTNTSRWTGYGLFARTAYDSKVQNFSLVNSYFAVDKNGGNANAGGYIANLGSIVGYHHGYMSNVYSNATIASNRRQVGGIMGYSNSRGVSNVWFDGTISVSSAHGREVGGIVGVMDSNNTFENILFTGEITHNADRADMGIGGIIGITYSNSTCKPTLKNIVAAGKITKGKYGGDQAVGSVVGLIDDATVKTENVYVTPDLWTVTHGIVSGGTGSISGTITSIAEADLYGTGGYRNTLLDFDQSWAARSGEVPGIKAFVKNPLSIANTIRPDTSWYNAEETRQEILDEADMYGFMELMAEGNTFAGKEIYLMADLSKMNKVENETIDKWKAGTEVPDNQWVSGTKFAGTFDGGMHTISGIYLNTTAAGGGLFGEITATGVVKNLYIKDSLFKSTAGKVGSVAGISYGTISTVYSDADVVSSQLMTGGIVGNMKDTARVDTCWYAGDMKLSTKNGKQAGGIVGYIDRGSTSIDVDITDCLYTGTLEFEVADAEWAVRIGGIVGGAHDYRVPTINLENCVSAGTITQSPSSANHLGASAVYGGLDGAYATALNFVNVYAIKGCFVEERIYDKKVNGPKVTGTGLFKEKTDLQGVKGYQNTLLNFEDTWVAREGDVPALKAFTNEIGTVADLTGVEQNNWYNASETVFGISSASALKSLATYTDATKKISFKDKTIYLLDDIEINKVEEGTLAAWKAGTGTLPTSWAPIGVGEPFNGTFDGRMHTISGIYLDTTSTNTNRYTGFGMFARTGYNSTVRNFSLVDSYFAVDKNGGNANGPGYISNLGSIVGYHHGYLNNVYSNATMASNRKQVGGIMGYSNSRGVSNVWFDGTISVSSAHGREVGGIVGVMESNNTFENILFTGEITHNADRADMGIGGIIGITYSNSTCTPTLKNIVAAGKITKGKYGGDQAVGSVVGLIDDATVKTENVYVTPELWNVTHNIVSGGTGTLGENIIQIANSDLLGTGAYLNTSLDFTNTWAARSGKVPGLKVFVDEALSLDGVIRPDISWYDAEAPELQIQDAADMYGFMRLLAEGKTFEGQTIKVMSDLVMNPTDENTVSKWQAGTEVPDNAWVSGTKFAGTFDGNEKTISGIYCVGDDQYLGLFGTTLTGSTVKNFKLTDSYFNQTGTGNTGSIAGEVRGTIDSVYTDAIVEGTATHIGGIAALTNGERYLISKGEPTITSTTTDENGYTVIEQTVEATDGRYVINIKNCWFDGVVNAETTNEWARIGGIVASPALGRLDMDNCLFTGTIYTNAESENTRVGGFVGTRGSASTTATNTTTTTDDEAKTITKVTTNTTIIYEDTQEAANTMLYIDSSIAAGQIINTGNATVGAVVGKVTHGKLTNVYATRDTYVTTHGSEETNFTGLPIQTYNTDRLIGYCVEEKNGNKLDFENDWSMRISGVPIPKTLESVVGAENIVDVSTLTAEIGLNTWNKTLAEAVDYGMGNYVVSADATYETYTTYLATLKTLGFAPYTDNSESDMDDDGVYNAVYTKADGDWVLSITFVRNEGKVYISISTVGEKGLSPYLKASEENVALANTGGNVSFTMLEVSDGNGFIFQLPNGHFIVNDGGKKVDGERLIAYLREKAGAEPVIIDAWIFTHLHQDHSGAAAKLFEDASLRENVYVNGIYLSEPNLKVNTMDPNGNELGETIDTFKGLMTMTQEDRVSKPAVYRMHMGERYYFSGMTVDVVQTQEQIPSATYKQYKDPDYTNAMSTNCVYTLTKSEKKILLGGDSNNVNMQYMMMAYGKNYETYNQSSQQYGGTSTTLSNINVFAAYHHGRNAICTFAADRYDGYVGSGVATNEWADYLLKNTNNASDFKFDTVLFPYHQVFDVTKYTGQYGEYNNIWLGDDKSIVYPHNMTEINKYYIDNAAAYYTYGYEDYVNGVKTTAETRHGSVQFIYKQDESVETVIRDSNITQ